MFVNMDPEKRFMFGLHRCHVSVFAKSEKCFVCLFLHKNETVVLLFLGKSLVQQGLAQVGSWVPAFQFFPPDLINMAAGIDPPNRFCSYLNVFKQINI